MSKKPEAGDDENMGLGLLLTAIQILTYFSFIALCCFNTSFANMKIVTGTIPNVFYMGLVVIAMGILMTVVYVMTTNKDAAEK